jgi:single stranded DNA-binding protein
MNKSIISGNLGRDAEIKQAMANARKYIVFTLANTEKIGSVETTTWFQCFIHNQKICESTLVNYLKKGTKVLLEGRQMSEIWNKPDGTNVVTNSINVHSIELMGSSNHQPVETMASATPPAAKVEQPPVDQGAKNDDDLPF